MSENEFELAKEVVIVRRRKGGGEEGHHGGAWKIAYADFMTAMMAFFLVMWLVSMTDDKTIVQIANYFNPLQLTDAAPSKKGLRDADPKSPNASGPEKKESGQGENTTPGRERYEAARKENSAIAEAKIFVDPMSALDNVASASFDIGPAQGPFEDYGLTPEHVASPGEGERWERQSPAGLGDGKRPYGGQEGADIANVEKPTNDGKAGLDGIEAHGTGKSSSPDGNDADKSEAELSKKVFEAVRDLQDAGPQLAVQATSEGVLLSVMDHDGFEMFKRSSAEPEPQTLRFLERVTPILLQAGGKIVIRGHTDATTFRTSSYDNWRLSTARAHMVHYMLRRAGLPDQRLEKIEGLADTSPRIPSDPYAAQNRRIEILLKVSRK